MLSQLNLFAADDRCPSHIQGELQAFDAFGTTTQVAEEEGLTYFVNEFWTSRQRQADRLHEISYRACFKPQLPAFFIDRLTVPGDTVYDPFMGRGTTPLQASLMGRRAAGSDVNPLSAMLLRPRLLPPPLGRVHSRLNEIVWRDRGVRHSELLVFYSPSTLAQILTLRDYLIERTISGAFDAVDDWIRMVALNRLTGHSAGFFSVYTLPPNQACSIESQRKINDKRSQTPPDRNVAAVILKKSKSLLSHGARSAAYDPILGTGPADNSPFLANGSIDLVVTSPPFLDVVQYAKDNWLRCWFAGIDADAVPIAMHRRIEDWEVFVRQTFMELARVVRSKGTVAFEVGEVRNGSVLLERHVARAIEGLPFVLQGVLVNEQVFTKTANCWGVSNGTHGTNSNRIVIAQRN